MKNKNLILGMVLFFLIACSNDENKNFKVQNTEQGIVQIEQNDEKTELSDSNIPLPVDDEAPNSDDQYYANPSVISSLYKQKCAICHGEKGELKSQKSVAIKTLNKEIFIRKMQILKDKEHGFLSKEQIQNLADFINKGK